MDIEIKGLLNILRDNQLVTKYQEIPDEFDHADELKAQIEVEGEIPESMRYFEINGYSNPYEFEKYLSSRYSEFKLSYVAQGYLKNSLVKNEIKKSINETKIELEVFKQQTLTFKDIALTSLIDKKIAYCDEICTFIESKSFTSKPKRNRKSQDETLSIFKQKQVIVFFHYIREAGIVTKDIDNITYANIIADLTGYDVEKIRQDLSNIKDKSVSSDSTRFILTDYSFVKATLASISKIIDQDSQKKIKQ